MKWYQMRWAQKYWGKEARERYRRYLQSDTWKTKRKAVLQAAGFRCRRCGAPATEVHHETYKRIYNEQLSDLTALCGDCHETAHSGKKQRRKEGSAQKRGYQKPKQRRSYQKRKTKGGNKRNERHKTSRQHRLVSACFDGTFGDRDRGLFMLGVSTGGRISELQNAVSKDPHLRITA